VRRITLDQLEVGHEGITARRTITEADIAAFSGVSGDFASRHIDQQFADDESDERMRVAHELLVTAISSGLRSEMADWYVLSRVETQRRFHIPVSAGDTVHGRWRVQSIQPSRTREGAGVVRVTIDVVNQRGEVVQSGSDLVMVGSGNGEGVETPQHAGADSKLDSSGHPL
jgi:acyl dehydratase